MAMIEALAYGCQVVSTRVEVRRHKKILTP